MSNRLHLQQHILVAYLLWLRATWHVLVCSIDKINLHSNQMLQATKHSGSILAYIFTWIPRFFCFWICSVTQIGNNLGHTAWVWSNWFSVTPHSLRVLMHHHFKCPKVSRLIMFYRCFYCCHSFSEYNFNEYSIIIYKYIVGW